MLRKPDAADWLMYSRTYDAQRYSPLDEIDRDNVGSLTLAWSKPLGCRASSRSFRSSIAASCISRRRAAATAAAASSRSTPRRARRCGNTCRRTRRRRASRRSRSTATSIYYTAPAPSGEPNPVIALDAATGAVRWQTPVTVETHTAGALVVEGKVISGRACNTARSNCYLAAHDARTGKEVWRFHTSPGAGEPGDESWGGTPVDERRAATWGLPGIVRSRAPTPLLGHREPDAEHARRSSRRQRRRDPAPCAGRPLQQLDDRAEARHGRARLALPASARRRLGHGRRAREDPDPHRRRARSRARQMDQPERVHAASRATSPSRRPRAAASGSTTARRASSSGRRRSRTTRRISRSRDIDVETGVVHLNPDVLLTEPGQTKLICYWNTRSFWPTAYSPKTNSLYVPYIDHCLTHDARGPAATPSGARAACAPAPTRRSSPASRRSTCARARSAASTRRARPATARCSRRPGDLLFWGDIGQVLRAFDAETGKILWESEPLGATVQTSTITYAVDGKQYVAVDQRRIADRRAAARRDRRGHDPRAPRELDQRVRAAALGT